MSATSSCAKFYLRGSPGIWKNSGPDSDFSNDSSLISTDKCRVSLFSRDGSFFAFTDGKGVNIMSTQTGRNVTTIDKPKTVSLIFSPKNSLLATWEPYSATHGQGPGNPNLNIWDIKTGVLIKSFIQKKMAGWWPKWTGDEKICGRSVNNEVHFFEDNKFDNIATKMHMVKVADFSMPINATSGSYPVACYVPGSKGQPSFVRLFKYPNFGGPGSSLCNKSFYKADSCSLHWNSKGTALLVLTATDTSTESYYGDQGLHFMSTNGESCLVTRSKNGPVYSIDWNPISSTEFCVVYGFMPAKATLYNMKCEPTFDFGTGPRNCVYYNPFGNILCFTGFGNLQGTLEFWDVKSKKLICNTKTPDTTFFEWSPDGIHALTATLSPRLRIGNGYRVWHYTGVMLHETRLDPDQELWEAIWQTFPKDFFKEPAIQYKAVQTEQKQLPSEGKAYVPPHVRKDPSLADKAPLKTYEPPSNQKVEQKTGPSKSAIRNQKRREAKKKREGEGHDHSDAKSNNTTQLKEDLNDNQVHQSTSNISESDRKIRNLTKKLKAIQLLKEQQQAGKKLELNQLDKIKTESTLIKEIEMLKSS